jgi:hypothetical protein
MSDKPREITEKQMANVAYVDGWLRGKRESDPVKDQMLEALKVADTFITNGIMFGYIRMPDPDTPDAAHKTPGIIRQAIEAAEKEGK